jgi:hypothetical protein
METKEGDLMKSAFDGQEYTITKVANGMVILESLFFGKDQELFL